jgi:hypothetical protein
VNALQAGRVFLTQKTDNLQNAFHELQIFSKPDAAKRKIDHNKIREITMFTSFTRHLFVAVWHVKAFILVLIGMVVAGAAAVTLVEKMPFNDTLYFAFVTGLTIGYGDIVPQTPGGRLVALLIGFVGILFTGLMVAVLVFAVRESLEEIRNRS